MASRWDSTVWRGMALACWLTVAWVGIAVAAFVGGHLWLPVTLPVLVLLPGALLLAALIRYLAAKDKGQPWDASKGFDDSAPISAIRRWDGPPPQGRIALSVNGAVRQDAVVADMIWNVAEIVSEASKLWALAPGDLIFSGTPAGVAAVERGDLMRGHVEGVGEIEVRVV